MLMMMMIIILLCPSQVMARDVNLEQPDPSHHEEHELRQALGSMQEEVRAKEASAENGQNGAAVRVERGLIVFFGSIQVTTCPFKHGLGCLHLLSGQSTAKQCCQLWGLPPYSSSSPP